MSGVSRFRPSCRFAARRMNCAIAQASGVAEPVPSPNLKSGRGLSDLKFGEGTGSAHLLRHHPALVCEAEHRVESARGFRLLAAREFVLAALAREQSPKAALA